MKTMSIWILPFCFYIVWNADCFLFSDCRLVLNRFIVLYQKIQTANNIGFGCLFELGGFGDQENFLIPLISITFEGCRWLWKFKTPKRKKQRIVSDTIWSSQKCQQNSIRNILKSKTWCWNYSSMIMQK